MRGLSRTRSAIAAIFVAVVFTLVGASAASAVVPGGVFASGCVSNAVATGCTNIGSVAFPGNPVDVAVSPDNANVYVTTSGNGLMVFARGANGQLTGVQCLRATAGAGCGTLAGAAGLSGPGAIAISPDGASVYVANSTGNRVLAFDRVGGGALALKAGSAA